MPKLILDGDARGAVRATADVTSGIKRLGDETRRTAVATAQADKESVQRLKEQKKAREEAAKDMRRFGNEAAAIMRANEQPLDSYNRKMRELARLVVAGALSHQEAGKAAKRYKKDLDDIADSGREAHGTQFSLTEAVTTFAGTGTLIRGVSAAYNDLRRSIEQAAQAAVASLGAGGELQQVATSGADFLHMRAQGESMVRAGVFRPEQRDQADRVAFTLRNAGYNDADIVFLGRMATNRQIAPENLLNVAEGVKKYQDIFGSQEAGSLQDVTQKIWRAAGETQSDFATVAKTSTQFGSETSALGFSDEEALAAYVSIEKATSSPEETATRMRSMLTQIAKRKLKKGSLTGTIDSLIARVHKGESAIDILGETRAAAGLNVLANPERRADYDKQLARIRSAPTDDYIGKSIYFTQDSSLSAAAALQRETGTTAVGMQTEANLENLGQAVLQARKRKAYEKFGNAGVFLEGFGEWGIGWVDSNESIIRGEARGGFSNVTPQTAGAIMAQLGYSPEDIYQEMKTLLQRQADALEEIAKSNVSIDHKTRSAIPSGRER